MTSTTTRINHKRPAIADSRPKGGNTQQPLQDNQYRKELETYIQSQWDIKQPDWFITIQWTPAPYTFMLTSHHARHFRNIFLTSIYSCSLKKLPRPEDRCRLIWFHERAEDPEGRLIYHSHLHLIDHIETNLTALDIRWIIDTKVAPGFKCFKNLHRSKNPAIKIKPWNRSRHGNYNLKDYYTYKYNQDADLVLDYEISDLITTK
jgi:hypothetical protein